MLSRRVCGRYDRWLPESSGKAFTGSAGRWLTWLLDNVRTRRSAAGLLSINHKRVREESGSAFEMALNKTGLIWNCMDVSREKWKLRETVMHVQFISGNLKDRSASLIGVVWIQDFFFSSGRDKQNQDKGETLLLVSCGRHQLTCCSISAETMQTSSVWMFTGTARGRVCPSARNPRWQPDTLKIFSGTTWGEGITSHTARERCPCRRNSISCVFWV